MKQSYTQEKLTQFIYGECDIQSLPYASESKICTKGRHHPEYTTVWKRQIRGHVLASKKFWNY